MNYRNLLDEYYEYLGEHRPVHKMLTNHLLCFADWLNEHAHNKSVEPTADPCGFEYGDPECDKCKDRIACSY